MGSLITIDHRARVLDPFDRNARYDVPVTNNACSKLIIIYITLNTSKEAESIAKILLERALTNCVNFFPITCSYVWEGEITTEPETVLLVKTKENLFDSIVRVVENHITYTNFIGQIPVDKVNVPFLTWFNQTIKK